RVLQSPIGVGCRNRAVEIGPPSPPRTCNSSRDWRMVTRWPAFIRMPSGTHRMQPISKRTSEAALKRLASLVRKHSSRQDRHSNRLSRLALQHFTTNSYSSNRIRFRLHNSWLILLKGRVPFRGLRLRVISLPLTFPTNALKKI